jgi:hypothetical protein
MRKYVQCLCVHFYFLLYEVYMRKCCDREKKSISRLCTAYVKFTKHPSITVTKRTYFPFAQS